MKFSREFLRELSERKRLSGVLLAMNIGFLIGFLSIEVAKFGIADWIAVCGLSYSLPFFALAFSRIGDQQAEPELARQEEKLTEFLYVMGTMGTTVGLPAVFFHFSKWVGAIFLLAVFLALGSLVIFYQFLQKRALHSETAQKNHPL